MPTPTTYLLASWGLTSSTWLILWSVLAAMTLVLIILLRTRWSGTRPMRKCAILSLWVHILLAIAATTVRIISGAPDLGDDTPIRVSVIPIMPVEQSQPPEEEITPDWEIPQEIAMVAPEPPPAEPLELETSDDLAESPPEEQKAEPEELPQQPAPPLEAPSLLAAPPAASPEEKPEPEQVAETTTEEPQPVAEPEQHASNEKVDEDIEQQTDVVEQPSEPQPVEVAETTPPTPPSEPQPDVPAKYADRFSKDRNQIAEQRGGSEQTEKAVRAALGWLASAQARNGGWDASQFGAGHERHVLGENRHGSGAKADMGVTGLALLAFLGSGHTHLGGPYAKEVAHGLEYLRQRQRADGSLFGDAKLFARMYCHSMATFAVCEAYALTGDRRLEPMARAAVRYAISMQHPRNGGWRYRRGDTGDTSQLGWQLMALKSAQLAGIEIPEVVWTRVESFMRRVKRGQTGGLACYRPGTPPSRTMTAEAMFCRQLLYSNETYALDPDISLESTQSILEETPSAKLRNLYFWYYATLALHGNQNQTPQAAEAWETWNHALTHTLLSTQEEDGSWNTATLWGGYGGRVYTTALSAMCLEVYYRYTPAERPRGLAGRKGWNSVQR